MEALMFGHFDIWQFLAGLGIFLFGLHYLELALKNLVGRPFKKFLRNHTDSPIKGVLGGALITSILQSSSVVSLMVMAFVGAGIITMRGALGIIFGSNLGTTFTGWIVALIGFKLDVEGFALPLVAVGGLTLITFANRENLYHLGRFIFGFGLLFIGLNWMKESIEYLAETFDVSVISSVNPYLFFLVGLVLTAIVQSSSAVMVIALSALTIGAIPLDAAASLIIGSNIGTTVTVSLGAIKGTPSKKQVALGHVLFNTITAVVALAILYPMLWLITDTLQITDPLYSLVTFHTFFNLLGVLMLLPFIGRIAHFLESRTKPTETKTKFISKVSAEVPVAAIEALRKESIRFCEMVVSLNAHVLRSKESSFSMRSFIKLFESDNYLDRYAELKQLEGEIVNFSLKIQNEELTNEDAEKIHKTLHAIRQAMQAAKNIKSITHNIHEFETSSNDAKVDTFNKQCIALKGVYDQIRAFIHDHREATIFDELSEIKRLNHSIENEFNQTCYGLIRSHELNETEVATMLIAGREFYTSNKVLINALADLILDSQEADAFQRMD